MERSEQLARRKEIYLALHPQTKAGQAQALGMNKAKGNGVSAETAPTFAQNTAAKTNLSKRTIQEDVQIANRIAEPVRNAIHADCGKIIAHLI